MDTATYIKRMEEAVKKASHTMSTLIAENRRLKSRVEELESIIDSNNYVENKQQKSSIQQRNLFPTREDILGINNNGSSIDSSNVSNDIPLTKYIQDKLSAQNSANTFISIEDDHLEDISNLIDDELDDDSDIDIDSSIPMMTEVPNVKSTLSDAVTRDITADDITKSPINSTYRGGDISTNKSIKIKNISLKRNRCESSPIPDNQLGTINKRIFNDVSSNGRLDNKALENSFESPHNQFHNSISIPLIPISTESIITSTATILTEPIYNISTTFTNLPQTIQSNNAKNINPTEKGTPRKVGWDDISSILQTFPNLPSKKKVKGRKSTNNEMNDNTILFPELQVRALLNELKDSNIHSIANALQSYKASVIISEIILSLKNIAKLYYNEWTQITQLNEKFDISISEPSTTSPVILKKISLFVQLCLSCLIGDKDATHIKIDNRVSKRKKFLSLLKSRIIEWMRSQRLHEEDGQSFPFHIAFFSGTLSSSLQYLECSSKTQSSNGNNSINVKLSQSGNADTDTVADIMSTANANVDIKDNDKDSDSDSNQSDDDDAIFAKETLNNGNEVSTMKTKTLESIKYDDHMNIAESNNGDMFHDSGVSSHITTVVSGWSTVNPSDDMLMGLDDISDLDSSGDEKDDNNNECITQDMLGGELTTAKTVKDMKDTAITKGTPVAIIPASATTTTTTTTTTTETSQFTSSNQKYHIQWVYSFISSSLYTSLGLHLDMLEEVASFIHDTILCCYSHCPGLVTGILLTLYGSEQLSWIAVHHDIETLLEFLNYIYLIFQNHLVKRQLLPSTLLPTSNQTGKSTSSSTSTGTTSSHESEVLIPSLKSNNFGISEFGNTFSYVINMIEKVHLKICSVKSNRNSIRSIFPLVNQQALAGAVKTSYTVDSMFALFKSLKEDQKEKLKYFINSTSMNTNTSNGNSNSNGYLQRQYAHSNMKINPMIGASIKSIICNSNKAVNEVGGNSYAVPYPSSITTYKTKITLIARSLGFWKSISLACSSLLSPSTDIVESIASTTNAASATATNNISVFSSLGLGNMESIASKLLYLTSSLQSKQSFKESDFISGLCLLDDIFLTRTQVAITASYSNEGLSSIVTYHSQEAQLLARFRHYWEDVIYTNNNINSHTTNLMLNIMSALQLLNCLISSVSEYSNEDSSSSRQWHMDGVSSSSSLDGELMKAYTSLKTTLLQRSITVNTSVTVTELLVAQSLSSTSPSPLALFALTSVTLPTIIRCTSLIDFTLSLWNKSLCSSVIPPAPVTFSNSVEGEVPSYCPHVDNHRQDNSDIMSALRRLLGLYSAALFEQLVALSCVSIRALLHVISSQPRNQEEVQGSNISTAINGSSRRNKDNIDINKDKVIQNRIVDWNVIIPDAISFLSNMSILSGGFQHAEMLLELATSIQCLQNSYKLSPSISIPWTPKNLTHLFHQMSSKLPVIIINLDRRADRWRKCLDTCSHHGILPIRYSAIDGTAAGGDMAEKVPESAVTLTWDSTFNHRFDASCVANKSSILTNSERACAASHLRCWMALHKLFQQDPRNCSLRKSHEDADSYFKTFVKNEMGFQQLLEHTISLTRDGGMGWTVKTPRGGHEGGGGGGSLVKSTRYSIIFEDDMNIVDFSSTHGSPPIPLSCHISDCVYRLPMDFDICYLGYALPKQEKVFEMGFLRPKYLWQLHAYILSEYGVAKLLQHLPIDGPVDNFIATLIYDGKLKAYAVKNQLVRQVGDKQKIRQKDSDIIHSGRY